MIAGPLRYSAQAAIRAQVIELLAVLEPELRAFAATRPDCDRMRFSGSWLGRAPELGPLPECQLRHPACMAWADDVLAWHRTRFGNLHDELTFSAIAGYAGARHAVSLYSLHARETTAWAAMAEASYPGWTSVRLDIHETASAEALRALARDIHAQLKGLKLVGQRPGREGHIDRPARAILWKFERGLGSSYRAIGDRWQQRTTAWAGDVDALGPSLVEPPDGHDLALPAQHEWAAAHGRAKRRSRQDAIELPSTAAVRDSIRSLERLETAGLTEWRSRWSSTTTPRSRSGSQRI